MTVETGEFSKFVRRIVRAYGRRVGDADEPEILEMLEIHKEFEAVIAKAMISYVSIEADTNPRMRTRSWATIGRMTGMTRQGARQKWLKAAES